MAPRTVKLKKKSVFGDIFGKENKFSPSLKDYNAVIRRKQSVKLSKIFKVGFNDFRLNVYSGIFNGRFPA